MKELYCLHPNIVRSSLKSLSYSDIENVQLSELLIEADFDWNIRQMKESPIFAAILCKYHKDLVKVSDKHPFCWAISGIDKVWPALIDFLTSHQQSLEQLMFLKEFILEIFSSFTWDLIQYDIIEFLSEQRHNSLIVEIVSDILNILPNYSNKYYAVSQKLIKVVRHQDEFDIVILLDQLLTRFEYGYPVMEMSRMVVSWDFIRLKRESEIALVFTAAYILSKTLDRELCRLWIAVLEGCRARLDKLETGQSVVLKRILIWPLLKIKTEKSCQEGKK